MGPTSNWSEPLNWNDHAVPANGDTVQFGSNTTSTDDISGLSLTQIHFTGSGNTINGTTTLNLQDVVSPSSFIDHVPVVLDAAGGNKLDNSLSLRVTAHIGIFLGADVFEVDAGTLTIASNITAQDTFGGQEDDLHKDGAGTLELQGINNFAGETVVQQGVLALNSPGIAVSDFIAVGPGFGQDKFNLSEVPSTTVRPELRLLRSAQIPVDAAPGVQGGIFNLNGHDQTIRGLGLNSIPLTGGGALASLVESGAGTLTVTQVIDEANPSAILSGNLSTDGNNSEFIESIRLVPSSTTATPPFIISANIIHGGITIEADPPVPIEFQGNNTYAFDTIVRAGTLLLDSTAPNVAIPGNLTIGNAGGFNGTVRLLQDQQLPPLSASATVTVLNGSVLDLNNHSDSVYNLDMTTGHVKTGTGTLTVANQIDVTGSSSPSTIDGKMQVTGNPVTVSVSQGTTAPADLVIPASIHGSGGFDKTGDGSVQLTGSDDYTDATTIESGVWQVDGTAADSPISLKGGTLKGGGTVGAITATGGTVAPGDSPGILQSGTTSFDPSTTFFAELNGTMVGADYSQLNVTGSVSLGGAHLTGHLGYTPADGDSFTIIQSTDGVTGQFAEGSQVTIDGQTFTITYNANSVVLTAGVPIIGSLSTSTAVEGSPDLTLTVNGTNFTSASTVDWNGADLGTTTYVSSTELQATVPAADLVEEGSASITVVKGSLTSNTVSFQITDPNILAAAVGPILLSEGSTAMSGVVATFSDPGGLEAPGEYSAMIDWGDQTQPTTGTIDASGGLATGTVSGSHTYANEEGSFPITVTIKHLSETDTLAAQSAKDSVTISDPNITAAGIGSFALSEGAAAGRTVSGTLATFSDPGGLEAPGEYSAMIDWGDQTQPTTGTIDASGGLATGTVSGSHTYANEEGSFPITVTIKHLSETDTLAAQTATDSVTIFDPNIMAAGVGSFALSEGPAAGRTVSGTLATFSDPGGFEAPGEYSASIKWGDGNITNGTIDASGGLATGTVSGSHTYASEEGSYTIKVTITHLSETDSLAAQTVQDGVVVADAPLHVSVAPLSAIAGAPFSGVVASFTDDDSAGTLSDYTATITWGDGNSSAGNISSNGSGGFNVSGGNTYAAPGFYPLSVQVNDMGGSFASGQNMAHSIDLGISVQKGQTATIGFWNNPNGQMLINSFNGGPSSTVLANWLAATFGNLYGSLAGQSNVQVAAYFQGLFNQSSTKLEAQVLDTALDVYATTSLLSGTTAARYGFKVTAAGLGASDWNVGASGAAFGVANNTTLNVYQLLKAANKKAVSGVLYNGDKTLRNLASNVFGGLITAGDIGTQAGVQAPTVQAGQTATIGFWDTSKGQTLINHFHGSATSTTLGSWLAANFANLYGSLAGKTNAQVAAFYRHLFNQSATRLEAEVLDVALDVYATTLSLGGKWGSQYGFKVTSGGLGTGAWNVGGSGAAFGVANHTTLHIYQLLKAANRKAVHGVLNNGDEALRNLALSVFRGLIAAGEVF
jgi:autotransporter-associated beta strand protein